MTLILFSAPFSVTYTHTHTHTRVSLGTGRAFVSEKNRRLTCYTVTNTRDLPACLPACPPHTHKYTTNQSIQLTHRYCNPQQLSYMQRTRRRECERRPDNLADTPAVHKDTGENKQADVSNKGGFEHSEGIWVVPTDEPLTGSLSSLITDADEGD